VDDRDDEQEEQPLTDIAGPLQVPLEEKYQRVELLLHQYEKKNSHRSRDYKKRQPVSYVRTGGRMWWLFVYDLAVCIAVGLRSWIHVDSYKHSWMVWTAFFYFNASYSVLMFPYLLLQVPVISSMVSKGARPTGYDASGFIGAQMNPAQIQERQRLEEVDRRKRERRAVRLKIKQRRAEVKAAGGDPRSVTADDVLAPEEEEATSGWWVWPRRLRKVDLGDERDETSRKMLYRLFGTEADSLAAQMSRCAQDGAAKTVQAAWAAGRAAGGVITRRGSALNAKEASSMDESAELV